MDINSTIESVCKEFEIKPQTARELGKLGIKTVSDLLFYFPSRHEDFSEITPIAGLREGKPASIKAEIKEIKSVRGFRGKFMSRAEAVLSDGSGSIKAVWFNQPYMAQYLSKGETVFLSGAPRNYKGLQLQNPIYEKVPDEKGQERLHTGRIVPIYKSTQKLAQRTLRNVVFKAIKKFGAEIKEYLPENILAQARLESARDAAESMHFPESAEALEKARDRMAFDEIFFARLAVQKHKRALEGQKAAAVPFNKNLIRTFVSGLEFKLTDSQKRAIWDILQDLEKSHPMNRMLEGDVGSGKTLVAFTAALEILDAGLQAAMLCPTEILARQHYQSALKFFDNHPHIGIILLTSKTAEINGRQISKRIALEELAHKSKSGRGQFVISTHAILQKSVKFANLGFVIIDEQHRFGVRQRAALLKSKSGEAAPHLLSMSATPIPRTLRLALFGDLKISRITEKPRGRKPIITKLIPGNPAARQKTYDFIASEIKKGGQCFVIAPLIGSEESAIEKSAISEYAKLKKTFKEFKAGLLHGKMKAAEKEAVMADFLQNKIQILVSTSVVEVGVDAPNANIMLIEGAESFGLAQLHQFRGRVGRSEKQSYCLLFENSQTSGALLENKNKARQRLEIFAKTSDGFELAELDLKMRGFGNIFGEEQSGFYGFKYFSGAGRQTAEQARRAADQILAADPQLKNHPKLLEKIQGKIMHLE